MKLPLFSFLLFLSLTALGQTKPFVETFDSNDNGWPFIAEADYGSLAILNGHLVMTAKNDALHTYKDVGLPEEGDFAIYARMIFLDGIHTDYMGIRFMMSPDATKYCSFVYTNDKGFLIAVTNGKKREVLRQSKSAIVRAADYNTLTVIKSGSMFRFLINDKQVFEAKIKDYFGPMISLITNSNIKMQVDEIQVYDPVKGKVKTIPSTLTVNAGADINQILTKVDVPPDYKQFYDSFEKFAFPYDYSTVIDRERDITQLSFVQKKFFEYEISSISNHTVSAIAHLAICPNADAFLIASKYTINNQVNTRFSVEVFDKTGNSLATKDVGSFVLEPKGYYKTLDFKITRDGNSIFIDATERFYNGNRQKNGVSFNTELCNL